ncbi:MAG TPA: HEAT repeat domain-containing protein [Vicinamibacterales bacterium]|nr:HEAT repeat domain-containing protein [Vicinamibacterales bacterium]
MTATHQPLSPELSQTLTEFARACKAAARAVSLYPPAHPAIGQTLGKLVEVTDRATAGGAFAMEIRPSGILIGGAAPAKPDGAIGELAALLNQHLIGRLVLQGGADQQTWRGLLMLLARPHEDNRRDGGIELLWSRSGGPSIELHEIDYAEVLRERAGDAAVIDDVIAACLKGTPRLELDEESMRALLGIVNDPEKLRALLAKLDEATAAEGRAAHASAFLKLLKGLAEYVARSHPDQLEGVLKTMADAAGSLSADAMVSLLAQRMTAEAQAGALDVVDAVVDRISDPAIAGFVAGSVIDEHGATDRLAQAFGTLVPESDRKRQLLALAEEQVAQSPLGHEETFEELWDRVEKMLTTYSDQRYVSDDYARELSGSRARALEVEKTSDDPPDRIAGWVATVSDAALRDLDMQLLTDLLMVETDPARWRDVAESVIVHLDDLARVGQLEEGWRLAELIVNECTREGSPRATQSGPVLARLARSGLLRQAATALRTASDQDYGRFNRMAHLIGPAVIGPLTETLAGEQDPKARRRLRETLIAFGRSGRAAVQELLNAPTWEVRRTAAYLLSEFGGTEDVAAIEPLLTDREPRVQREGLRVIVHGGGERAFELVARVLATPGPVRSSLAGELVTLKDERAGPLFSYLLPRIDRHALRPLFLAAIEALGSCGGTEAVEALKHALYEGDTWRPFQTRTHRRAAAEALRRIGSDGAREVLNEAAAHGPRGVCRAARAELRGVK